MLVNPQVKIRTDVNTRTTKQTQITVGIEINTAVHSTVQSKHRSRSGLRLTLEVHSTVQCKHRSTPLINSTRKKYKYVTIFEQFVIPTVPCTCSSYYSCCRLTKIQHNWEEHISIIHTETTNKIYEFLPGYWYSYLSTKTTSSDNILHLKV